jgi:hypothetical protein
MPTSVRAILLATAFALLTGATAASAVDKRIALLIGIADYPHLVSPQGPLQGPVNDVAALRAVLIERWGFLPGNIRTLVDRQATRAAMLDELRALEKRSSPGDDVFVFYSGHGTSALDSRLAPPLPQGSGAMVPADYDPAAARPVDGLIVGRSDLKPIIERLEAGGRRLWVVSDSCYSGNQVRSVFGERGSLPGKFIPLPGPELLRDLARAAAGPATPPSPYPYSETAWLSAAAEGEVARDIPTEWLPSYPTVDGKPHGALADALLRVLDGSVDADYDRDGFLSWAEIHAAVSGFMADRAYGHSPQRLPNVAEDSRGLAQRAFLGQRVSSAARRPAATTTLQLAAVGLDGAALAALQRIRGVELLAASASGAELVVRQEGTRFALYSAGGDALGEVPAAEPQRLVSRVQQLAWARRLHELGQQGSRGLLDFEVQPATFGGNFRIGECIHFVVKPQRASTLLLLNVDAAGLVSVLYPYTASETQPLPAGKPRAIPGSGPYDRVRVSDPPGMDLLFAFAFDRPPAGIERLFGLQKLDPTDPRLAIIEGMLADGKGEFSFAHAELRALSRSSGQDDGPPGEGACR